MIYITFHVGAMHLTRAASTLGLGGEMMVPQNGKYTMRAMLNILLSLIDPYIHLI